MVDEVGADLGVTAGFAGEQHFRPHAVRAGDEDRLLIPADIQGEESAEGAHPGQHLGSLGGLSQRLDQLDRAVPGIDVDARIAIGAHVRTVSSASLSISSCTGTGTG